MAFTTEEENGIRQMYSAYQRGKKINEMENASGGVEEYTVEVQDKTGESKQLNLYHAISNVNKRLAVRRWNLRNGNPAGGEAYGNIDFLRELPGVLGLGCYLVSDTRKRKKLDSTVHTRFYDGSPASLDGSMGQYMWCWNEHYVKEWVEGDYYYLGVSDVPMEGGTRIPAGGLGAVEGVLDRTNGILCSIVNTDPRYRGGGNQAAWDNTYRSVLGCPAVNINGPTFSTYARKRGEGWEANWFVAEAVSKYLFFLIFGNTNSQAPVINERDENGLFRGGLGSGVTTFPDWGGFNGYYPMIPTSAGVELGDSCGEAAYNVMGPDGNVYYTVKIPVFFGLKNPFGHIWKHVRGLTINVGAEKTEVFVAPSMIPVFTDNTTDGLLKATECPRGEGYVKRLSFNRLCAMPTELGASTSTYFCDYFWHNINSQGFRVRLSGASANNGANAGFAATYAYDASSYAGATTGSRLCYFDSDPVIE